MLSTRQYEVNGDFFFIYVVKNIKLPMEKFVIAVPCHYPLDLFAFDPDSVEDPAVEDPLIPYTDSV